MPIAIANIIRATIMQNSVFLNRDCVDLDWRVDFNFSYHVLFLYIR